jgi:hypothetical protein
VRVMSNPKVRLAVAGGLAVVAAILVGAFIGSRPASWFTSGQGRGASGVQREAGSPPGAPGSGARAARRAASIPQFSVAPRRPPRFKPVAFLARQAQHQGFGYRKRAREFFVEETRDEAWAGQMEGILRARFDEKTLRSLNIPSLRVDELECRTSSCRLEVSWDDRDDAVAQKQGERVRMDPLSLVTSSIGPLAAIESRDNLVPGDVVVPGAWAVRRRDDGRLAVRDTILFSENDIDPDSYRSWVAWVADNMRSAPNLVR